MPSTFFTPLPASAHITFTSQPSACRCRSRRAIQVPRSPFHACIETRILVRPWVPVPPRAPSHSTLRRIRITGSLRELSRGRGITQSW